MYKSISVEWIRFKRRRSLYAYVAFFAFWLTPTLISVFTAEQVVKNHQIISEQDILSVIFKVFANTTHSFVALFIIYEIGLDYKKKILQRNIIDGYSRSELVLSRLIFSMFATFSIMFIVFPLCVAVSFSFYDKNIESVFQSHHIVNFIRLLLSMLLFSFIAVAWGFFILHPIAGAVSFYVASGLVEGILDVLDRSIWKIGLARYFPFSNIRAICLADGDYMFVLLYAILFSLGSLIVGIRIFNRRELS